MKVFYARVLLTLFVLCLPPLSATGVESWNPMTEKLPPYTFQENGQVHGICADILLEILAKNSINVDRGAIKMLPWARAYRTAQTAPGSILFSAARTAQREKMFKWVGPMIDLNIGLITLKKNKIELSSLGDAKKYKIGAIRDGVAEQLLLKAGLAEETLDLIASPELNIKKLQAGRIDLFAFSVPTARYLMLRMGMDPDEYESVYTLKRADLYYAFHKDTDDKLIRALNRTLEEMRKPDASGKSEVDRIVDTYLNP